METPAVVEQIPFLENGDRLTRDEFERRYNAMPHLKKAELLDGVVYMPSPVRYEHHAEPHSHLNLWLALYAAFTPGVRIGDNGTVRLSVVDEPQPDVFLFVHPECGGRVRLSKDDYVEQAPELVAEVSASTVGIDTNKKKGIYCRSEVREYLVWRVDDREIDWFVLRDFAYQRLAAGADGVLRSEVFPGLWLDPAALLGGDAARNLAVCQQGLASPEHAAFVARLHQAKARGGS